MLTELLSAEHRDCDELFAEAENAAHQGDLDAAGKAFASFAESLRQHLSNEEEVLFPAFEARTGISGGPTAVMRMEHEQMRALLDELQRAIDGGSLDDFLGLGETFNILIQQHNMKEEQMLYPMCDRALGEQAGELLQRLQRS